VALAVGLMGWLWFWRAGAPESGWLFLALVLLQVGLPLGLMGGLLFGLLRGLVQGALCQFRHAALRNHLETHPNTTSIRDTTRTNTSRL
jgi:hypothetical protein